MKAITIWQPWAEFIAAGVKHNETRSWATKYRGPIAIHAAVKPIRQVVPLLSEKAFGLMVEKLEKASMANGELLTYFNYGEIIATAELVACHLITEEYLSTLPDTEKALGDYSLGRYAWELRNIKELPEPIKAKGQREPLEFVPSALSGPQTHREEVKRRNDRSRNHARRRRVCIMGRFPDFVSNRNRSNPQRRQKESRRAPHGSLCDLSAQPSH